MPKVFEALGTIHTRCCATCQHWNYLPRSSKGAVGECEQEDNQYYVEVSDAYKGPVTLDLAICSKWQEKEDAE